jgi:ABC-type multidrug transport system fused ATPase/permease subunit
VCKIVLSNNKKEKTNLEHKIEISSAILLAVVIVCIAWSSYQSTLWGGVMTFKIRESNSNMQQFMINTIQQGQYSVADVILFTEYIDAISSGDQELADFYFQRLRPEFKPAVQAWLDMEPFENPHAAPHPFVMQEYKRISSDKAEEFRRESSKILQEALQANTNSDNFILVVVIYSSVLFVLGILDKITTIRLRLMLFSVALAMFSIATINMFSLPLAPPIVLN